MVLYDEQFDRYTRWFHQYPTSFSFRTIRPKSVTRSFQDSIIGQMTTMRIAANTHATAATTMSVNKCLLYTVFVAARGTGIRISRRDNIYQLSKYTTKNNRIDKHNVQTARRNAAVQPSTVFHEAFNFLISSWCSALVSNGEAPAFSRAWWDIWTWGLSLSAFSSADVKLPVSLIEDAETSLGKGSVPIFRVSSKSKCAGEMREETTAMTPPHPSADTPAASMTWLSIRVTVEIPSKGLDLYYHGMFCAYLLPCNLIEATNQTTSPRTIPPTTPPTAPTLLSFDHDIVKPTGKTAPAVATPMR